MTRVLIAALLMLTSCVQGHCRRQQDAPDKVKPLEPTDATAPSKPTPSDRVLVYKYDGSLQCGMGKPVAPEVMAKELGSSITLYSSIKKADGLMHIQVCGSPTGMANVFEIPAKSLKAAEAKGFKKWSFE